MASFICKSCDKILNENCFSSTTSGRRCYYCKSDTVYKNIEKQEKKIKKFEKLIKEHEEADSRQIT